MITRLLLEKNTYKDYTFSSKRNKELTGLSKINLFVGQNNSGKSRFLRKLLVDENFEFALKKNDYDEVFEFLQQKRKEIDALFESANMVDGESILQELDGILKGTGLFKIGEVKKKIGIARLFGEQVASIKKFNGYAHRNSNISYSSPSGIVEKINIIGLQIIHLIDSNFSTEFDFKEERIYIPILKGLRPIQANGVHFLDQIDNYKLRTIRDYFSDQREKLDPKIFTGLSLYEDTKKLLLGDKEGRNRIKKFEEFLKVNFFENKEVTLIPDITNDVLLIGIGDEERPVYELGDGIQSIIILLYPLFFNQDKNLLVFIEEPENSMHPGMQRIFLETLMKEEFKNFQFFITTHSNHFLDITLDIEQISIYTFTKKESSLTGKSEYCVDNISNEDVKILDLLGARTSSVFTSNCTIWVEGITDRLYIKKYLEIFQADLVKHGELKTPFREDYNYSFVEYGGGNIVHWSFTDEVGWDKINASKLSSKIFVVADKDSSEEKPSAAKAARLNELKEKLKDNFKIIDAKEIENTLSGRIVIDTVQKMEGAARIHDEKKITFDRFKDKKIGGFIQSNFQELKRKYEAASGTIYPKLEFCKVAVEVMKDIEDLSIEGRSIARDIFKFIQRSN